MPQQNDVDSAGLPLHSIVKCSKLGVVLHSLTLPEGGLELDSMARPRVFVNRQGKPVKEHTGVSFNKARRRFYIIRSRGKRQEFRTWAEARAAHAAGLAW